MPICKKCNAVIPSQEFINGAYRSLRTRKYCLQCSPFGAGNNRKLEIERPLKRVRMLKGEFKVCSCCKKKKLISGVNTQCGSCKNKLRRQRHKDKAFDLLGNRCSICGYDRCKKALDMHHTDPSEKEFGFSANWHWSWDRLENEVKKCVLVCNRCHAEIHDGLITT